MVGGALALLVLMNDFGTSLLFFGVFLAMLYLATSRLIYVVGGLAVFALGAYLSYRLVPHVADRVDIWLHPWQDVYGRGYQSVQALYAIADGGAFGTGLGRGYLLTTGGQPVVPAIQTDFIYAAIANETGLAGVAALLLVYLLVVAARAQDGEPRRRRLLEAAGGRAHDRARPAGLPDRGRHRARCAADRHHAPVRVVRRVVARRQLGRAGAAAAQSPTARGARPGREPRDRPRLRRARLGPRAAARVHGLLAALGGAVARRAPRQRPPDRAAALDPPRADHRRRRHEAGDQPRGHDGRRPPRLRAPLPDEEDVRARRRLLLGDRRPGRGRALRERLSDRRAHRSRRRARRTSCTRWRAARSTATTCSSRSCRLRSERP